MMNLKDFFDDYEFHDSPLDDIVFDKQTEQLSLSIDLCLFNQKGYQQGGPENQKGTLVFSQVKQFIADPDIDIIDWKTQDGQILDARLDDKGMIVILFSVSNYSLKHENVYEIKCSAQKATWRPSES